MDIRYVVEKLVDSYKPENVGEIPADIIGDSPFTKAVIRRFREWDIPFRTVSKTAGNCPVIADREWCDEHKKMVSMTRHEDIDTGRQMSACAEAVAKILFGVTDLGGKNVVIIGRGFAVRGLANVLLDADATVTICHSHTQDLLDISVNADVIINASPAYVPFLLSRKIVIDVSGNKEQLHRLPKLYVGAKDVGLLTCAILARRAASWKA